MLFSKQDLRRLIIPLIIEQILAVTIGMADTVMVASVGEAAVSGISLVDSVNQLLINIFSAMATGGAVVCSQYLGRQERNHACDAAKQLLLGTTVLALILMVTALLGRDPIIRIVFGDIEADVFHNAQIYMVLSAISYPFLAIYNAGAALYRSMGNSKISMYTSVLMNLVNIGGNALTIFVFQMGVAGAGLATLLSRALGAVIMMVLLTRNHTQSIYIQRLFHLEFRPQMMKSILRIGIPNGLENSVFQVGKVLVQSLISSFGTTAIAANAVASNIASMMVLPGSAIGLAMITVVGRCVGAKDYDQAKHYTFRLMKYTYLFMGILDVALLACTPLFVRLYNLTSETAATALWLMIFYGICAFIIWPSSFVLPNALRAANDVRYTMIVSIVSMWLCRIVASYILARGLQLGVKGVWIAMVLDWVFRSIFFIVRFQRGKWREKQLLG